MLLDRYEHAIDSKSRITLPAKYRSWLDAGVVVTKGLDRCLMVYPLDVWKELADRVSALPLTNSRARELKRRLFGDASHSVPDKQGRIILQPRLREFANLDSQAVINGVYTYCEIWNPEIWAEREARGDSDPEALADLFDGLDV